MFTTVWVYPVPGSVSTAKLSPFRTLLKMCCWLISASAAMISCSLGIVSGSSADSSTRAVANLVGVFGSSFNMYVGARVALVRTRDL